MSYFSYLLTSLAAGGKLKGLSPSVLGDKLECSGSCDMEHLGVSTRLLLQRQQASHIND